MSESDRELLKQAENYIFTHDVPTANLITRLAIKPSAAPTASC